MCARLRKKSSSGQNRQRRAGGRARYLCPRQAGGRCLPAQLAALRGRTMAGVRTRASKRRIDVEDTSRDARSKKRRIEAEDAPRDAKGKSKAKRKLDFGEGAERAACAPTSLPREIAEMVLWKLDATDLASLAAVDRGCRSLAANEHMWQLHVEHKWGAASALMKRAAALAGGWQQLYAAKSASDAYGGDWTIPSHFETEALLDELVEPAVTGDCDCLDVVFLLDGSGSVSHDDFVAMTGFVQGAARVLTGTRGTGGGGRSGGSGGADRPLVCPVQTAIVQFSNDTQVELELGPHDFDTIQEATVAMERMSGGTNIAQPLMLAQTMMEDESRHPASLAPSRAVVLLTGAPVRRARADDGGQPQRAAPVHARRREGCGLLPHARAGRRRGRGRRVRWPVVAASLLKPLPGRHATVLVPQEGARGAQVHAHEDVQVPGAQDARRRSLVTRRCAEWTNLACAPHP